VNVQQEGLHDWLAFRSFYHGLAHDQKLDAAQSAFANLHMLIYSQ
jgi:hypothetical protein